MRRKIDELRENLDEFVQQDEYPVLVVGCLGEELAYVIKFLQSLEQVHPQHVFLVFEQPFDGAGCWVDAAVARIREQVEAAAPLRAERGEPPFPAMPPGLADPRRPAATRLHDLLRYLVSLVPAHAGHRVVVGLLPLTCSDFAGYAELVASTMPTATAPQWIAELRIVAYDDRAQHRLLGAVRAPGGPGIERVLTFDIDFSTAALTDQLGRDAADPSLPAAERMSCLMQLAALDYSYRRYPDALEKYGVLFRYYAASAVPSMQALALLGTGDTLRAAGRPLEAKARLQQGIAIALADHALPILLNLLLSITATCMELAQPAEAESYADSGIKVAAAVLQPFAYADLHEARGDAQLAQGRLRDGLTSYDRCAQLCELYGYCHRWGSVLERKRKLYEDARLPRERREVERELLRVRALERDGGAHDHGAHA
jgi:hypothetical protein